MIHRASFIIGLCLLLMTTALRTAPEAPAPQNANAELEVALTCTPLGTAYRGWPIIIEATLMPPFVLPNDPRASSKITIAPKGKPWTSALRLEVRDASGSVVEWPFHLVPLKEPSIELAVNTEVTVSWWLSPEETLTTKNGEYRLSLTLEVKDPADAAAWTGTVTSSETPVSLTDEPAPLDISNKESKAFLHARLSALRGDLPRALALIEGLLKENPDSITALGAKASILEELGKPKETLDANNLALLRFYDKHPDSEPPLILIDTQTRLLKALLIFVRETSGPLHGPDKEITPTDEDGEPGESALEEAYVEPGAEEPESPADESPAVELNPEELEPPAEEPAAEEPVEKEPSAVEEAVESAVDDIIGGFGLP